ncbi:TadE/TadG family type IV pilus assembly protein [Streptomyces griseus]|uniref:TadE/TadG family type IV pilus assembly protein n=1 Tax=Streptomyces griseus TaxID=1911 RepID=UPI003787C184
MTARTRRGVRGLVRRLNGRGDRGFGSVELAVLALVLLVLGFIGIQWGLYSHGSRAAQSAARHGVESGRQFGAGAGDGVAQAEAFLARFGGSVQGASVSSAGSSAQEIRITVRGRVATLVPGLTVEVVKHAEAPIERWTTP